MDARNLGSWLALVAGAALALVPGLLALPWCGWLICAAPFLAAIHALFSRWFRNVCIVNNRWSGFGYGALSGLLFTTFCIAERFVAEVNASILPIRGALITSGVVFSGILPTLLAVRGYVAAFLFLLAGSSATSVVFADSLFDAAKHRDSGFEFVIVMAGVASVIWAIACVAFALERKRYRITLFLSMASLLIGSMMLIFLR